MDEWERLPGLEKDDYVPLYVQLSNILAKHIRENGLDEGEPVPSENELISHYRISRNTVRQAFQLLESQDIIRRVRGRGTFVAAPKLRRSLTGMKVIETRLAEMGVEVANETLSIRETFPPREWGRRLGLAPGDKAILLRRVKTADGVPFALEERVFPMAVGRSFSEEDLRHRSVNLLIDALPRYKVVHIVYTFTASPLTTAEAKDLKTGRGEPVVRRLGLYRNREDEPVMFGRLTFLSDKFELSFEFLRCEDESWIATAMS